jgi:hypothetical protein
VSLAKREACGPHDHEELTREEMEQFLREKEQIRSIVGRIGGKPTTRTKVVNILMFILIIATLLAIPFVQNEYHTIALEVGILILSLKIFLLLHNEAKVTHFQFWMLSSLEWRMNDIAKRLARIDDNLQKMEEQEVEEKTCNM